LIANYEFANGQLGDVTSNTITFNFVDIGPISNISKVTNQERGQYNTIGIQYNINPNGHLVEDVSVSILDAQTGEVHSAISPGSYDDALYFNGLPENRIYYAILEGTVDGVNQTLASTIGHVSSSMLLPGPVIGNVALDVRYATTSDVYVELIGNPVFVDYVTSASLVSKPQSVFNLFNFNTVTTQLTATELADLKSRKAITVETVGLSPATNYVTTLEITGNNLDIDSNNQVSVTTLPESREILHPNIYSAIYYQATPGVPEVTVD